MTEPMATDEICPSLYAHGASHHAVPRRNGRFYTNGESASILTCQYCGATYHGGVWVPMATTTNTNTRRVQG